MFSNSAKYALKAILYLALHSNEEKRLMVKDIHGPINVPKTYLAKLLQELARHGIVSSIKGPKGGFYISKKNKLQPVSRIIDIIDGKKRLESCLLSLEDCDQEKPCPLHQLFVPARSKLINGLENKTIEDLSHELRDKKAFLPI
ncbi:RrF2 family transcriptional regulator [Maribacter sp. 2304DJ31-5]|uniref:RrF2 family transcriptional regulator n=1 Tax=Maribacter sp. 2304DJ31-5 TaxID=3386273 RepID=UPI0039BC301E